MTNANASEDVFHVSSDDEEYVRMLREEEEFWDTHIETLLTKDPAPAVQSYLNERLTGDADKLWYETIGDRDDFTKGCVFGAGPGQVEEHLLARHPQLHLTIFDISSEALSRLQERLDEQFRGRAETRHQDLNFVELPAETYDLLVANDSMHHLVNLEHVAFQASRSLKPQGRFFMTDVVGESYFQFSDEKKRIFQTFMDATHGSGDPQFKIDWPSKDDWTFSPFESVRSGEILDVFERYFLPLRVRTASALLSLTLIVHPDDSRGRLRRKIDSLKMRLFGSRQTMALGTSRRDLLFFLDGLMCDSGRLVPGQAFAIYGKRGG